MCNGWQLCISYDKLNVIYYPPIHALTFQCRITLSLRGVEPLPKQKLMTRDHDRPTSSNNNNDEAS